MTTTTTTIIIIIIINEGKREARTKNGIIVNSLKSQTGIGRGIKRYKHYRLMRPS